MNDNGDANPHAPATPSLGAARWLAILSSTRDAIICIDSRGLVSVFNPSAERMFGYSAEQVIGHDIAMLMPAPYAAEHAGYVRTYQQTRVAKAIGKVREVEAKKRDGTIFPIELSVAEVTDNGDTTYAAIIRDVSERQKMEEELRSQRDFADNLIDTAHVIVLVLSPEGRIIRFNRHLEEISGFAFGAMRQEDWFTTFIAADDRDRIRAIFETALSGTEIHGHINSINTKSGGERQILWYAKRLLSPEGEVIGVISVGHDITERMRAEQRLGELEHDSRQNDRLADIGAITAKVVHDLGNPLAALTMQAQLILRRARRNDFAPAELVQRPVEQMLETLSRLEVLVTDFTEFSRERRLSLRPTVLSSYLDNVRELWDAYATAHRVRLLTKVEEDVPAVLLDTEMFRRALDNLIKNAIDSMADRPGNVTLATTQNPDSSFRISITDEGCGLPDDIDPFRLFESTKPDGTGIGLAIAKQIVEAHGGEIHYAARTGGGTVFHLDLPAGSHSTLHG